jgi:hypothetical protein
VIEDGTGLFTIGEPARATGLTVREGGQLI